VDATHYARRTSLLPCLLGLRGVASLMVALELFPVRMLGVQAITSGWAYTGVALFFILSGFLLAHIYTNLDFTSDNLKMYGIARVARICPVYLFVLVGALIFNGLGLNQDWDMPERGTRIFLTTCSPSIWAFTLLVNPHCFELWTIPVECQFYLMFVGVWYMASKGWFTMNWMVYFALTLAFCYFNTYPTHSWLYFHLFLLGATLGVAWENTVTVWMASHERLARIAAPLCFLYLTTTFFLKMGLLGRFLDSLDLREPTWLFLDEFDVKEGEDWSFIERSSLKKSIYHFIYYEPIEVMCMVGLCICAAKGTSSLSFLAQPIWQVIGNASYGIYVFHPPLYLAAGVLAHNIGASLAVEALLYIVAVTLAGALGWLSFTYVEKRALRLLVQLTYWRSDLM
jgi:peptidoglycan/LPS O-acetylase OafA/YrhL